MALFSLSRLRLHACKCKFDFKRSKYYVLLPEIPDDSPENNPLLRTNTYPPFSKLTTEHFVNAIGKYVVDYESEVHKLRERLQDPAVPKNVQNVILPLDQLSAPLDFAWSTLKVLYVVKHNESFAEAYVKLFPRILRAKQERYLGHSLHQAFKEMKADEKQFAAPVQRVTNKFLLESQLCGIELSSSKYDHLVTTLNKLEVHKKTYREKLRRSTRQFLHVITKESEVHGLPRELLYLIAVDRKNYTNGPWQLTLSPDVYKPFMEYCNVRMLRWNLWQANCIRASTSSGVHLNNSIDIEEMRYLRNDYAELLGFKNYAELSMKTKMAGTVENVMSMITTLHAKCKEATVNELDKLQTFASENGFEHKLEQWDVPYWQRRHKEALFNYDEASFRQYFPFPTVLKGLFSFCEMMFGIKIQEASGVDTWHEDVSFYHIYDENDTYLASFYVDPYARPESKLKGAWMEVGRNKSDLVGADPLSYLILNFHPPRFGKPSLLSFSDLHNLLEKFGHVLQHSLTTVPYSEVSGLTNLEWDVVNVVPHVMSHWLCHYDTVAHMSGHVDTGERIPKEIHQQLYKAHCYMAGLNLSDQLHLSALDIDLYSRKNFWYELMKENWLKYCYFPFYKEQAYVCSFRQIFVDEYPAAYFSFTWAKMIAADVFSGFEEVGLDNKEAIQQVGKRFRDTYLSLGGGYHSSEVFRRFRGRDPSTEALLCSYGLMHKQH